MSDLNSSTAEGSAPGGAGRLVSAREIDGRSVYSDSGEHLGKLHHLVLDQKTGKAVCAVVSFGGLFGLGQSYFPIPWPALRYDPERRGYVSTIPTEKLEGAPSYVLGHDPVYNPAYTAGLFGYYGLTIPVMAPMPVGDAHIPAESDRDADPIGTARTASSQGSEDRGDEEIDVPRIDTECGLSSKDIEGSPVYSRDGELLGSIKDLQIDEVDGSAANALLSYDGRFSFPEKIASIPWAKLKYREETGTFIADVSPDVLLKPGTQGS